MYLSCKGIKINLSFTLEAVFHEDQQVQESEFDPTFDWIAEAKKRKFIALEDNKGRLER